MKSKTITDTAAISKNRIGGRHVRTGVDADTIAEALLDHLRCLQAKLPRLATRKDWYMALAYMNGAVTIGTLVWSQHRAPRGRGPGEFLPVRPDSGRGGSTASERLCAARCGVLPRYLEHSPMTLIQVAR
jgi:hypothetical protein